MIRINLCSQPSVGCEKSEDEKREDGDKASREKDKGEGGAEEEDSLSAGKAGSTSGGIGVEKHEAIVNDLKTQLKKSQEAQKELKLLLDMYKTAPKEQRDKVELMASEKRSKAEITDLKALIAKHQENKQQEKKKVVDEDQLKKMKKLEEDKADLERNLGAKEQEETMLLNEMEVRSVLRSTGYCQMWYQILIKPQANTMWAIIPKITLLLCLLMSPLSFLNLLFT